VLRAAAHSPTGTSSDELFSIETASSHGQGASHTCQ
jgi:hypothetical protein